MKLNRILSALLVFAMVCTLAGTLFPVRAGAAASTVHVSAENKSKAQIEKIVRAAQDARYGTAEQMLTADRTAGYLDSVTSADGRYTLYINRYTGVAYYVNNLTGQILTSNPIDVNYATLASSVRATLLSQIELQIEEIADVTKKYTYDSTSMAAERAQIKISSVKDGLRVNYTIGETATRYLVPGMISAKRFYSEILSPMIARMEALCEARGVDWTFTTNRSGYEFDPETDIIDTFKAQSSIKTVPDGLGSEISSLKTAMIQLCIKYIVYDPNADYPLISLDKMYKKYPVTETGLAVAVYDEGALTNIRAQSAAIISRYCPEYNFTELAADEKECGYVAPKEKTPVVRCALEYTLTQDGVLTVRLPANSITFDETVYELKAITPLKYFGAGDMTKDGYILYPDGSGALINFSDFYDATPGASNYRIVLENEMYGKDFAFGTITGAHREQLTMPVFGIVNEVAVNEASAALLPGKTTVRNGFFAVVEEGASLATMCFTADGAAHKFATVYTSYEPYASDEVDLSESLGVSSLQSYDMISKSRYDGSYTTRYTMLADDSLIALHPAQTLYTADYNGMAACYRAYLRGNGTLHAIETVSEDLPLYIEAFGSMKIQTRVLTFPVTKAVPLTTFNDILTMYAELSGAKETYRKKAQENRDLAAQQTDAIRKQNYLDLAATYDTLATQAKDISNINFRLSGFANGGMYYTYPVRCRWERACGGAAGLQNLLSEAERVNAQAGKNFGVYPEFDFMYINNTALFDGIGNRGNVSRMIDNRYASKQIYSAITREYDSLFAMVISADALDRLYGKFRTQYAKIGATRLSVSTLGSDLNSNFDRESPVMRADAETHVRALLERMSGTDGYELMVDRGNSYTWKYVKHILNASIDSSHFRYTSYTIPFFGMVLHGSVSYAGSPLNYTGTPSYNVLRSIENGAAPYYILSYQNTMYMKEDKTLNKYYGVNYATWFDEVVKNYGTLNDAIGDLQTFEIVKHRKLLCERVIEQGEQQANLQTLKDEWVAMVGKQAREKINDAYDEMRADPANIGRGVHVTFDRAALLAQFARIVNMTVAELEADSAFTEALDAQISKILTEYSTDGENAYALDVQEVQYESRYRYLTDSKATDEDYEYTDYTCDNGNVVMVTYQKGTQTVHFLLNYNIYAVDIRMDDGTVHRIEKYGFRRIG